MVPQTLWLARRPQVAPALFTSIFHHRLSAHNLGPVFLRLGDMLGVSYSRSLLFFSFFFFVTNKTLIKIRKLA